jgi:hypothetical protein
MDKLDQEIEAKRREVAHYKAQHDAAALELRALERAAALRPSVSTALEVSIIEPPKNPKAREKTKVRTIVRKGGRQPGSISPNWQNVLRAMYRSGNRKHKYDAIHAITERLGLGLSDASTRDRVRNMTKTGLLSGNPARGFAVTDEAVAKFGLAQSNEAPNGKPVSASEAGEGATSPNESQTSFKNVFG